MAKSFLLVKYNNLDSVLSPKGWTPAFQSLSTGEIQGYGQLAFQMAILNRKYRGKSLSVDWDWSPDDNSHIITFPPDDFSGPAESTVFPLGSFVPIWAAVNQQGHQPLALFLEECVASTTPEMNSDTLIHPLITNKGCVCLE